MPGGNEFMNTCIPHKWGKAINPSGHEPGIRGTWIRQDQAAEWLEKHDREIDWNERLAK